jgi:hypothetical protein
MGNIRFLDKPGGSCPRAGLRLRQFAASDGKASIRDRLPFQNVLTVILRLRRPIRLARTHSPRQCVSASFSRRARKRLFDGVAIPADMTCVIGDILFTGDTLFMPDYGTVRADFPGGYECQAGTYPHWYNFRS